MNQSYDVAIIGAGIVGTSTAHAMAKAGYSVICIDPLPAAGYGSTSNSSAIVRTPYSTLDSTALAWESLQQWRQWRTCLGDIGPSPLVEFYEAGMLYLNNGHDEAMENSLSHLTSLNIPWTLWNNETVAHHFPGFDMVSFAPPKRPDHPDFGEPSGVTMSGGYWTPDAGYISDPAQAAQNLKESAECYGAQFMFHTKVCGIQQDNGRVTGLLLEGSNVTELSCRIVVNAAGPYSTVVNAMANVQGDMLVQGRPLRQETCSLQRPVSFTRITDQKAIVMDTDAGVYYRTEPSNKFVVGGTEPACDPLEWIDEPETLNKNPTDNWTAQVYRAALRIPSLSIPDRASGVADLYDVTQDWTPIYDRSCLDGFYMAVGTSGNQFKNGPMIGSIMKTLIEYCESGSDHDSHPCHYTLPLTGNRINLATFSRKRTATEGIGNVLG